MEQLGRELNALAARFEGFHEDIFDRLESEEYLGLIRKGFRIWDQADTDQKRSYIAKLLANAEATKLADDDLNRLFLDWLDTYHEAHFKVIRHISQHWGMHPARHLGGHSRHIRACAASRKGSGILQPENRTALRY